MRITFYGAAQNVTGAKHLVQTDATSLLLDCGMHQGRRSVVQELNRTLPFAASSIDAVILSHGHLDHCGMLPALVKGGFAGSIYCTPATADVADYIMQDAAALQEQDCAYINGHLQSGEQPAYPLYTGADVKAAVEQFEPVPYYRVTKQWQQIRDTVRFKFYDAGHILGSAVTVAETMDGGRRRTLAYTGDLGSANVPLLRSPEIPQEHIETLIMECTYGNRAHQPLDKAISGLKDIIVKAFEQRSKIIVPAFALGRIQELIYILHKLTDQHAIPRLPIYIDSPLAESLTSVFQKHNEEFDLETWKDFGRRGESPFEFRNFIHLRTVEESKSLNEVKGPFMVIAASGMAEGGRIRHHLKHNIEHTNAIILITGYQAEHTLGRKIQEGRSPVRIFDRLYKVKARVVTLNEFSAHADRDGLLRYVQQLRGVKNVFLVHTELPQATAFKKELQKRYPDLHIEIPAVGESFDV